MSKKKIAVLVGSLRKNSYSRQIANALIKLAPESIELEIVEIDKLPLYNQDSDNDIPEVYTEYRNKIKESDGVLFITPEHNRMMSAVIKNAIDVASRPWGHNVWDGKPSAVISSSTGPLGGALANHSVRQPLVILNSFVLQQPEMYLGHVGSFFDEEGNLVKEDTAEFFKGFLDTFNNWVYKF